MRTRVYIFVGAVAAVAASLVFVASGFGTSPRVVSASTLQSVVMSEATAAGDSSPTSIEYSAITNRNEANVVASGDEIGGADAGGSYYLVVLRGDFTLSNAEVPPGAPDPTGTVMTLVIDATTGHVTDFGLQNSVPDMSAVGPTTASAPS